MNVEKIKEVMVSADTAPNSPESALVLIRELCKALLEHGPKEKEDGTPDSQKDINWALRMDSTVRDMLMGVVLVGSALDDALTHEKCIVELVKQKRALLKKVVDLDSIAPRRLKIGDRTYIWHCPDDMVPDRT